MLVAIRPFRFIKFDLIWFDLIKSRSPSDTVSLTRVQDIVQWALLAVRNLCEDNEANRQFIAEMQFRGPTPSTVDLSSETGIQLVE